MRTAVICKSRILRLFGLLLAACAGLASEALANSRWATLEAIHHLENPRNVTRPGAYGELGAYQFRRVTWKMHTAIPFERAIERSVSDAVAVKHYEWLKKGLEKAGMAATPYNIALAWNGGLDAAIRGRSPARAHDYATRASNLAAVFGTAATRVASVR